MFSHVAHKVKCTIFSTFSLLRIEVGSMHAAFAEWCRCRKYLLDKIFCWKGEEIYRLHVDIPPVFHETEDSKVDMITVFVSDSQEVGHRKIVLLPGPDVPQI